MAQSEAVMKDISEIHKGEKSPSSSEEEEMIQNDQAKRWENNVVKNKYLFNFKKWPVFFLLREKFLLQIKLAMIYDNGAVIVMRDNMVYAIGNNKYNRLAIALEDNIVKNIISPKKVEILCEKNIKKFAIGFYTFALTETGKIYYWDYNEKPVLRPNISTQNWQARRINTPTLLIKLEDKRITDIACNNVSLLALTDDGKVHIWMFIISTQAIETYLDFMEPYEGYIVCIACGYSFSMVVTNTGKIYYWLQQDYDDASEYNTKSEECVLHLDPQIIELLSEEIVKVVCGRSHALALTNEGKLYVLNKNQPDSKNFSSTLMNIPQINKVLDIASVYYSNRKVVLGDDKNIYVWGDYFNNENESPIVTYFMNMHEALMYNITDKYPIILFIDDLKYINVESDILECSQSLFNDQKTSDFVIKVDEKLIHVHKAILQCRSEHYKRMLGSGHFKESKQSVTEFKDPYSYSVCKTFLEYLYTGAINYQPMTELLDLYQLADEYCDDSFKEYIIQEIKCEITKEDVPLVSEIAKTYNAKDLIQICHKFKSDKQND